MKTVKFSINGICAVICTLFAFLFAAVAVFLYLLTDNAAAVYAVLFLAVLVYGGMFSFIAIVRKKLTAFSDMLCRQLDGMMQGNAANLEFEIGRAHV